jgi:hypothetical protein
VATVGDARLAPIAISGRRAGSRCGIKRGRAGAASDWPDGTAQDARARRRPRPGPPCLTSRRRAPAAAAPRPSVAGRDGGHGRRRRPCSPLS